MRMIVPIMVIGNDTLQVIDYMVRNTHTHTHVSMQ